MVTILIALTDAAEMNLVCSVLTRQTGEYQVQVLNPSVKTEKILEAYSFDLIVVDLNFQDGKLADFILQWSQPLVLIAAYDQLHRLEEIIYFELGEFILRDPQGHYIEGIPLLAQKILHQRKARRIQNSYIRFSEDRYYSLVQNLPDVIFHLDTDGKIMFINKAVEHLGCSVRDLIGLRFPELLERFKAVPVATEEASGWLRSHRRAAPMNRTILQFTGPVNAYAELFTTPYKFENAAIKSGGVVGIIRDITELYTEQRELERSNQEKTQLLREIHYRIRNNLQLILSLSRLHGDTYRHKSCIPLLEHIQSELHTIALAYEQLNSSESANNIPLDEYLRTIFRELQGNPTMRNHFSVQGDPLALPLSVIIPIGLLVCELILYLGTVQNGSNGTGSSIETALLAADSHTARLTITFATALPGKNVSYSAGSPLASNGSPPPETEKRYPEPALIQVLLTQLKGNMNTELMNNQLRGTISISQPML